MESSKEGVVSRGGATEETEVSESSPAEALDACPGCSDGFSTG